MVIYRIIFPNGKSYIGATTKTLNSRIKSHIAAANCGSDYPVHLALKKYDKETKYETLCNCNSLEDLYEKEKYYIDLYKSHIKENGYNIKPGGFCVTGTHGKNLSQKRKEFFLSEKNRIQSSIDHGGESFIVYDLLEQKIVGKWINQAIAAKFLGISTKHLHYVLAGRGKVAKNFTMVKEKDIHLLTEILKKTPKPFKTVDRETGIEKKWLSKSKCGRELGICRNYIHDVLEKSKKSNNSKYEISYY